MLFEHLWAKKFREIISNLGGALVDQEILTADRLAALGARLRRSRDTPCSKGQSFYRLCE
ncbi:MAG: hypothetical protein LUQ38_02850 [Methanotrichaceae archaeon]|nr:hypothetical protein [Methanotrichaceae archaeon]